MTVEVSDQITDNDTDVMELTDRSKKSALIKKAEKRYSQVKDSDIEKLSDSELADFCAEVWNDAGILMHLEDECQSAYATDIAHELVRKTVSRIMRLSGTDTKIYDRVKSGWYHAIEPFMERNGYRDGNGWWVKADNLKYRNTKLQTTIFVI